MKPFAQTAGAVALVLGIAGIGAPQSLGELARREEARRQNLKASARVYTNDSLQVDAAAPASRPAAMPAAPPPSGTPAVAEEPKHDEAYRRQRIDQERRGLSRSMIFEKALQSYANALSNDVAARDDPAQRSAIASDRQTALLELTRVQQDIQDHRKAIADIEEQARRAGTPAGWVR